MTIPSISIQALGEKLKADASPILIDVRTPVEFAEVHAKDARSMPLDGLDPKVVEAVRPTPDKSIYLLCKSGARAGKACEKLATAGIGNVFRVEGGTDAWVSAGLPTLRNRNVMSLERQVRITAGLLVLLGVLLGATVHPWLYALSGFVGAGLVFAGLTNTCGMGLLLARMPWNRAASCEGTCSH